MKKPDKPKEKLSPIPKPSKRREKPVAIPDGIAPAGPDLSYIAESLRPLAVPVGELVFDPANARTHDEANLAAIKGSLARYGQLKPIVANRKTKHVEAGNGTLRAALALNWSHIAVVWVDHNATEAAGFSISDNRSSDLSNFDNESLAKLMKDLETGNSDLDRMLADLAKEENLFVQDDPETSHEPAPSQLVTCPQCGHSWNK